MFARLTLCPRHTEPCVKMNSDNVMALGSRAKKNFLFNFYGAVRAPLSPRMHPLQLGAEYECEFVEVSAKTGINVEEVSPSPHPPSPFITVFIKLFINTWHHMLCLVSLICSSTTQNCGTVDGPICLLHTNMRFL